MNLDRATRAYASILEFLSISGMILISIAFALYALELLPASVDPEQVTQLWHLDSATFADQTSTSTGWGWIDSIFTGAGLSFAALELLAVFALVATGRLIPVYVREKDTWYLSIVVAQVVVFLVAATGILVVH